jgi:hypothetical protein
VCSRIATAGFILLAAVVAVTGAFMAARARSLTQAAASVTRQLVNTTTQRPSPVVTWPGTGVFAAQRAALEQKCGIESQSARS